SWGSTCRRRCSRSESSSARTPCSRRASRTRCEPRSPGRSRRPLGRRSGWTRSPRCRARRRSRRSSFGRGATPHISASGCGASRVSLWSRRTARPRRSQMTSSSWHAHGNVYLVADSDNYVMEPGLDGVVQVLGVDGDDVSIAIVNPDGSLAEMSGNGTRIAAAWLMERSGSDHVRVHVGPRVVDVRRVGDEYESDLGEIEIGAPETVDGIELTPVVVGNPHAVVLDDPARLDELGPLLETHPR